MTTDDRVALPPGLRWHSGMDRLGGDFSTPVSPTPLGSPHLVAASADAAAVLGIDPAWLVGPDAALALSGSALFEGSGPVATVYSGHQFGVWAGQLGDGRALLLGEADSGWEIQLKGAGRTPYSRGGDGRAVLRSSIREFLCSEAMQALGIPTTRALAVMGSPSPVARETMETAAVVTRLAPSFIRFGHFEHFSSRGQIEALRALADYVIERYYPDCMAGGPSAARRNNNPYASLLEAVGARTAAMVAQWQAVGFCHGVMNTDNMSILGLTIDYGPFQFLDGFDPGHVCNHSDTQGRYAYQQQPNIAYWNLFCLGQALMPLIVDRDVAMAALEPYRDRFPAEYLARMNAKLGLGAVRAGDAEQLDRLLRLMARERTDWTIFWRRLSTRGAGGSPEPVRDLFADRQGFDAWLLSYSERLAQEGPALAVDSMLKTNPKYVLRNHLGEQAIRKAQAGDFTEVRTLSSLLATPCDEHSALEAYAEFPPDWASNIEISCSS